VFSTSVYAAEFAASVCNEESTLNFLARGQVGWRTLLLTPPIQGKALQEAAELIQETFPALVLDVIVSLSCSFHKSLLFAVSLS